VTDHPPASPGVPGGEPDGTNGSAIDTTVPHSARIWNYWLGGKDNYEIDRVAGDEFVKVFPGIVDIARAGRAFLARAVIYLVLEAGIRQFLDVGTGLPTVDNTHELAQRAAPDSQIVYVDNDPLVLAHARALLTSTPEGSTDYVDADMRDPGAILARAAASLDLDQPVALMLIGVLGHIADDDEAQSIAQQGYDDTGAVPYKLRSREQVAPFFDGLEFVEPGLVRCTRWRPDPSRFGTGPDVPSLAAVARKP